MEQWVAATLLSEAGVGCVCVFFSYTHFLCPWTSSNLEVLFLFLFLMGNHKTRKTFMSCHVMSIHVVSTNIYRSQQGQHQEAGKHGSPAVGWYCKEMWHRVGKCNPLSGRGSDSNSLINFQSQVGNWENVSSTGQIEEMNYAAQIRMRVRWGVGNMRQESHVLSPPFLQAQAKWSVLQLDLQLSEQPRRPFWEDNSSPRP